MGKIFKRLCEICNTTNTNFKVAGYNGKELTRLCPACGKEKPLSEFGMRFVGLKWVPQSWCKTCRSRRGKK